jgi:ubiquinone/menaquinone biosynthesis C-methylase UbiE
VSLADLELGFGRRFARFVTNAVVARPRLWRIFRGPLRMQFDRLAPVWESMRSPESFAPLERALDAVTRPPKRALDLGTGTGAAARRVAERFPEAEVVGVDLSEDMLVEARRSTPAELQDRIRYETADGARLPFDDASFDLVVLANMIPFWDELERITAPDGLLVISFSAGPETPIWVPPARLRSELSSRGFAEFADFQAGAGTALLARKPARG